MKAFLDTLKKYHDKYNDIILVWEKIGFLDGVEDENDKQNLSIMYEDIYEYFSHKDKLTNNENSFETIYFPLARRIYVNSGLSKPIEFSYILNLLKEIKIKDVIKKFNSESYKDIYYTCEKNNILDKAIYDIDLIKFYDNVMKTRFLIYIDMDATITVIISEIILENILKNNKTNV